MVESAIFLCLNVNFLQVVTLFVGWLLGPSLQSFSQNMLLLTLNLFFSGREIWKRICSSSYNHIGTGRGIWKWICNS